MKNFLISKIASALLSSGNTLSELTITNDIILNCGETWDKEVTILNCSIENLNCMMVYFEKKVTLRNCHFKNAVFNFSYFQKGLIIEDCIFDKYLDFEAGGHNEIGFPIIIKNNEFRNFVNFCDCWFTGEVTIVDNKFLKGTNIQSKDQYLTFCP